MTYPIAEKAFIYGLKDPRTDEFRYVGRTRDPERREVEYLRCISGKVCEPLQLWLHALLEASLSPKFEILEEVQPVFQNLHESNWIAKLKREGHHLLNVGWSDQRRAEQSVRSKGNRNGYLSSGNTMPGRLHFGRVASNKFWSSMSPEQRKEFCSRRAAKCREGQATYYKLKREGKI